MVFHKSTTAGLALVFMMTLSCHLCVKLSNTNVQRNKQKFLKAFSGKPTHIQFHFLSLLKRKWLVKHNKADFIQDYCNKGERLNASQNTAKITGGL